MKRTESGLWLAPNFSFLKMRKRSKTVTLPNGERAKITIDDSGTVKQVEHGDHLDGYVRPATIHYKLRQHQVRPSAGGFARPSLIRSLSKVFK